MLTLNVIFATMNYCYYNLKNMEGQNVPQLSEVQKNIVADIPVETPEHPVAMPNVSERVEEPKKTVDEKIAEVRASAIAKERFSSDRTDAHKENKRFDKQKEKEAKKELKRLEKEARLKAREKKALELKDKVAKTKEDLRNKWIESKGLMKAGPEVSALRRKDRAEKFKKWTEDTADRIEGNLNRAKNSVEDFSKKQAEKVKGKYNDIKTDIVERREIANAKTEGEKARKAANKQAEEAKRAYDNYQILLMEANKRAEVFKSTNEVAADGHRLSNAAEIHKAELEAKRQTRLENKNG